MPHQSLFERRIALGLSRKKVGDMIGISEKAVFNSENGHGSFGNVIAALYTNLEHRSPEPELQQVAAILKRAMTRCTHCGGELIIDRWHYWDTDYLICKDCGQYSNERWR